MNWPIVGWAAFALAAAGCTQAPNDRSAADAPAGTDAAPGDTDDRRPFGEIAPDETVHFTGTEPFWGGQVADATLTYSTPENIDGTEISVERFAGRGGVSFGGQYEGAPFDMMITPGECSDGMSDRTYPYTVTLSVAGQQRRGCAWTDDNPRSTPPGYEP